MAKKDPAFLFYSQDFFMGTIGMSMEERGQYITLLCIQHQKGHLDEKTIWLSLGLPLGSPMVSVLSKFKRDADGLYYNERLDKEIQNRAFYLDSRAKNGQKGGRPCKKSRVDENHMDNHMDNHMKNHMGKHSESISFSFSNNNNNNNITGAPARVEKPSFEEVAEEMDRLGAANPHIQASMFVEKNDNDGWKCLSMLGGWKSAADAWMNALFEKEAMY